MPPAPGTTAAGPSGASNRPADPGRRQFPPRPHRSMPPILPPVAGARRHTLAETPMSALTSSSTWQALTTEAQRLRGMSLRAAFAADPERFNRFSLRFEDLLLDYSKHLID